MLTAPFLILVLVGQTTGDLPEAAALVEKLGAETEVAREAAKTLERLGSMALPALRSARKSLDPGIRSRASAVVQAIEGGLLVRGAKVRLDFQDATAAAVLVSLNNQTGAELALGPQNPNSDGPRITLHDSNPVPFWNAIDRFCEATGLVCDDQFGALPVRPVGGRGLVLSYRPDHVKAPSYDYGAFRIKVVMLFYHNELSYFRGLQASDRMRAPVHVGSADGRLDGEVVQNPRAQKEQLPANGERALRQGRAEQSRNSLDRTVRFRVELQIVPDRRMAIDFNGPPEVLEAVDELGNSLLPIGESEKNGYALNDGMMIGGFRRSSDGPTSVFLHRPQNPGRVIKKLRGTLDISIAARWPLPVVLPLTGAAGKVLENDEMRVVVKSIETDPAGKLHSIELTIQELDTGATGEGRPMAFPAGSPVASRHWRLLHEGIGPDNPLSRIQVVDSRGQDTFSMSTGSQQGSGPVTLRLVPSPRADDAKEIRLWTIVRTTAKIPFVFEDLPMP